MIFECVEELGDESREKGAWSPRCGQRHGNMCWGETRRLPDGSCRVQIRRSLLLRGPFSLTVKTLGHEIIHVRQVLIVLVIISAIKADSDKENDEMNVECHSPALKIGNRLQPTHSLSYCVYFPASLQGENLAQDLTLESLRPTRGCCCITRNKIDAVRCKGKDAIVFKWMQPCLC